MIIRSLFAGVLLAFLSVLLSEAGFRGKRVFAALSAAILLSILAGDIGKIAAEMLGFAENAGIGEVAGCAAKIVGVGYLFGIGADIVSELGESSISKALISAGKIEILVIVLPYFKDIFNLGLSLIK